MMRVESLAKHHNLCLFGFGGVFLAIMVALGARVLRTGTFFSDAFLKKCLAKCAGLMSLGISTIDGFDIFAVLALTVLLLVALIKSLSAAQKARVFCRSLRIAELPHRLLTVLDELPISPQQIVVFSGRLSFACTAGIFRPRVLVSTGMIESLSDEELKAVLRHEHSHLERKDPLRGVVMLFFAQFFIFLPMVSRLLDALRRDSELIADRHALALTSSPIDLASALVKTNSRNLAAAQGLARFWGDDLLGERLSRILNADRKPKNAVRARPFSLANVLAGLLLVLSLSLLVLPAGAGFLRKSPWRCPHADHVSCCAPADNNSHCSLCRP